MARSFVELSLVNVVKELYRVLGEERLIALVKNVARGAASAKASLDSNVDVMLSMANMPSRSDMRELQIKVETLHRTMINLSRKVDKLADAIQDKDAPDAG